MAAVLGGTMRSPFTSVIFALELTQDVNALLPCLIASMVAHAFTVLVMKRSILTEKVARRGFHLSREYSVDPLELMTVKDVMSRNVVTLPPSLPVKQVLGEYFAGANGRTHQGYPVVDDLGRLIGIVTRSNLLEPSLFDTFNTLVVADILEPELVTASVEDSCRSAAEKMAQAHVGRLPVVADHDPRQLGGYHHPQRSAQAARAQRRRGAAARTIFRSPFRSAPQAGAGPDWIVGELPLLRKFAASVV